MVAGGKLWSKKEQLEQKEHQLGVKTERVRERLSVSDRTPV